MRTATMRSTLATVCIALSANVAFAARQPQKQNDRAVPSPPASTNETQDESLVPIAFSVTFTPYHNDDDHVPVSDEQRREACLDMQNTLYAEFLLRHSDGQLNYAVVGLEYSRPSIWLWPQPPAAEHGEYSR